MRLLQRKEELSKKAEIPHHSNPQWISAAGGLWSCRDVTITIIGPDSTGSVSSLANQSQQGAGTSVIFNKCYK